MKNDIGLVVNGFAKDALKHMPHSMLVELLLIKDVEAKNAIELHNMGVKGLSTLCEAANYGLKIALEVNKELKAKLETPAGNEEVAAPSHYAAMQNEITKLESTVNCQKNIISNLREKNAAMLQAPVLDKITNLEAELAATQEMLSSKVKDKAILKAKLRVLGRILDTKNRYMDEMEKSLKEAHLISQ